VFLTQWNALRSQTRPEAKSEESMVVGVALLTANTLLFLDGMFVQNRVISGVFHIAYLFEGGLVAVTWYIRSL